MPITRRRTLLVVMALLVAVGCSIVMRPGGAAAQERAETPTVSPSGTPSPGSRAGDRSRSPGFVVLLVLLALGLIWQVQRARRTTSDVSARALDDLEARLSPERAPRAADADDRFSPPDSGK